MTNPVEPTAERTYAVQADIVVAQQGTLAETNARCLRVMVQALIDGGATCGYSCDGTTAGTSGDGIFRWSVDADVVFTDAAAAHSWVVLNLGAGFGGLYLMVTCAGVHGAVDGDFAASLATSWSGGTTTTDPSATSPLSLTNNAMLPITNYSALVQCITATDGSSYRLIANDDATGAVFSLALLETHYAGPAAYAIKQGGTWTIADVNADLMQSANQWAFYGATTGDVASGNLVLPAAANPFSFAVPRIDADGALVISSGGACDSALGWAGYVPDLWWARPDAATYRATIPATGRRWACFGSVVVPWDGATNLGGGSIDAALVQLSAGSGGGPAPTPVTIVATSPTPATEPGVAGGFPASSSAAAVIPIVLEVTGAALVFVTARRGAGDEEIVYRDGGFRGAFVAGSSQAGALTLSILPDGGWSTDVVISVDAFGPDGGASAHEEFGWFLPRQATSAEAVTIAAGSADYLTEALAALPWSLGQLVGA